LLLRQGRFESICPTRLAALAALLLGQGRFESICLSRFESEQWRNLNPIDSGDVRLGMAQDLLEHKSLVGKRRAEVLTLLGDPMYAAESSGDLRYELVEEHRGGNIDPTDVDDLVITFDEDGRVREAHHEWWHDRHR
jgi:hypothetical protein